MLFAQAKNTDHVLEMMDSLFIAAVNKSLATALAGKAAQVLHDDPITAIQLYAEAADAELLARELQAIIHVYIAEATAAGRKPRLPVSEVLAILADL